jgi:CHASE2 domain-containing sensor protein
MPAVIAMTRKVSVKTALMVGQNFYQHLRESGEVDVALQSAVSGLSNRNDLTVPALFSRLGSRPLFSDRLEGRTLTEAEIEFGIAEFRTLIADRAPNAKKLKESFEHQVKILETFKGTDRENGKEQQRLALKELNYLSQQVFEISFDALAALGKKTPKYEAECPFPGLAAFSDAKYHRFFFGRDELVKSLQKRLSKDNFLAVLGPSGSGKSSLVMAGLVPKLQQQTTDLVLAYLTPTHQPLVQLQSSISSLSEQSAVVVVDQFEELFTLCTDKDERNRFIDQLLDLAKHQKVIVTMRTDFLADCTYYRKLSSRLESSQKLIGSMSSDELGIAMKMQADQVLLEFETGLSDAILAEVAGEQGAMPLLQYALQELWQRRRGRWLCYDEYYAIGGVKQAIATIADQFYQKLSGNEQKQVRHIFEQLTRIDEDFIPTSDEDDQPKDTRRRVELNQLITENSDLEQTRNLVAKLANVRLVTTNRDQIEVAHETLILHWPLLQKWLSESRSRLKLQQQIRPTIQRWKSRQDDGELLRGHLLQEVDSYLKNFPDSFSQEAKTFINASQALPYRKPKLRKVLITSFCVTTAVFAFRALGIMQSLELAAYDQMMRLKPSEAQDSRFIIIAVNDTDILEQGKRNEAGVGTVKDRSLERMLQKLKQYQPRVIGLDLLRDFPAQSKQLSDLLGKNDQLIGICTSPDGTSSGQGHGYPVDIPKAQVPKSVGFSNFIDDGVVRRQPLLNPVIEQEFCPTENSFSFAIAQRYLNSEAINKPYQSPRTKGESYSEDLKFGQTTIKRRTGLAGGYQGELGEPPTYQVLLNYRTYQGNPRNFAKKISLEDFLKLEDKATEQKIKDKIVIIGIDSEVSADYVDTPYGKISGPIVQAQMVSQIISTVLDKRPLIWWWPLGIDVVWIGIWSIGGGLMVWRLRQPIYWAIGSASVASLIGGIYYIIFVFYSGWIPLIPTLFASMGTSGVLAFETLRLRQGKSKNKKLELKESQANSEKILTRTH